MRQKNFHPVHVIKYGAALLACVVATCLTWSYTYAANLSTASYLRAFDISSTGDAATGVTFSENGDRMYVAEYYSAEVYEYSLAAPWDISSASYVHSFNVGSEDGQPQDVAFGDAGSRMYVAGGVNDSIYEYALTTPWDISSASYVRALDVSARDGTPAGVTFRDSGTRMYVMGYDNAEVFEYALATAWDISSASYTHSYSVSSQEQNPQDVIFNAAGSRLYTIGGGNNNDSVYEYELSSAWDVSTASYVQSFYIGTQDSIPTDVALSAADDRMYVLGISNDNVYEYTVTPRDDTDPTVALTAPADGATLSGNSVAVTASASDNIAVAGVRFFVDNTQLGSEDTSAPYAITWNTLLETNGNYTLTAVARDSAGNTATSSARNVTVANELDDFLVGHWKLDETTVGGADSVIDASGRGNHGTPSGTPSPTTLVPPAEVATSRALTFDGLGAYVAKSAPTAFHTGTSSRSIAAWIRPTDTATTKVPFAYGNCGVGDTGKAFGVYLDADEVLHFWGCGGSANFSTSEAITPGLWTHVTVTYDGTHVRVYTNGTLATTSPRTLHASNAYWQIGSASQLSSNNYHFTGSVDDVRVYATALDANDVAALAARTAPALSNVTDDTDTHTATISWHTNVLSNTRLRYGLTSAHATATPITNEGDSATTTHSVVVANLPACTVYQYYGESESLAGDTATSSADIFRTNCANNATIESHASKVITTAGGGSVALGSATVNVPASFSATTTAATFQIATLDDAAVTAGLGAPAGTALVGDVFQLGAIYNDTRALAHFAAPLTISLSYSDTDAATVNEDALAIYRHNGSNWQKLTGCTTDTDARTVTCPTSSFSEFAIFGTPASAATAPMTGGIVYGCRDKAARNYDYFTAHKQELCEYDDPSNTLTRLILAHRTLFLRAARAGIPLPARVRDTLGIKSRLLPMRDLSFGATGADVAALQRILLNAGYDIPAGPTGGFFHQTRAALAAYQAANGITPAAGYFGPRTRAHMKATDLPNLWW